MYRSDVDGLLSNPVWREIVETLKETKVGLQSDLMELDPFADATKVARQQGRLMMLEFVLALPADILEEINSKVEEKTEDSNE